MCGCVFGMVDGGPVEVVGGGVQGLLVVAHLGQVLVVPLVAMEIVSDHSTLASIYDCSTSCSTAPLQGRTNGSIS